MRTNVCLCTQAARYLDDEWPRVAGIRPREPRNDDAGIGRVTRRITRAVAIPK